MEKVSRDGTFKCRKEKSITKKKEKPPKTWKTKKIFEPADMKDYTDLICKKKPVVLEMFLVAQTKKKRNTPFPLTTRRQTAVQKQWETFGIEKGKFAIILFMHPNLVEF